jgi:tetratricopeptide (TPR) repeat protein
MQDINRAISVWRRFDDQFNSFNAKREIGDLYVRANDNTNALIWFNRALEQNRNADLLQRIASLHINMNQPDRAVRVYRDFLDTNPPARERNTTLRNMGRLYQDLNNIRLAIQYYEQFLEHDWDRNVALWLVTQSEEMRNYQRALHWIQAMISRNSNDMDAIYFRALIAHAEGRFAESRADFQRLTTHATYGNSARQFIESIDAQN